MPSDDDPTCPYCAPAPRREYVLVEDVTEALDAIDSYAARDMDHDLHDLVNHYRHALGVGRA